MRVWPEEIETRSYRCSDQTVFLERADADNHERKLSLRALCNSVFGVEGSGHYGSLNGEDVFNGLEEHRHLFAKYL